MEEAEPRLGRAFAALYGFEDGQDATAEALAYAWENWQRPVTMTDIRSLAPVTVTALRRPVARSVLSDRSFRPRWAIVAAVAATFHHSTVRLSLPSGHCWAFLKRVHQGPGLELLDRQFRQSYVPL